MLNTDAVATTNLTTFPRAAVKVVLAWAVDRSRGAGFIGKRQTHQKAVHACGSEFSSVAFFIKCGFKKIMYENSQELLNERDVSVNA